MDVELYSCCQSPVEDEETEALLCEMCEKWTHAACIGMGKTTYDNIFKYRSTNEHIIFLCSICLPVFKLLIKKRKPNLAPRTRVPDPPQAKTTVHEDREVIIPDILLVEHDENPATLESGRPESSKTPQTQVVLPVSYVGNAQQVIDSLLGKKGFPRGRKAKIRALMEKPFACDLCKRRFSEESRLKIHRETHPDRNPDFKCHICEKKFARMNSLQKHLKVHTGEKPFCCEICGKTFLLKSALRRHQILHTGEKPFSCEICGRNFADDSNLAQHRKTHLDGEKPHCCETCGKTYVQKAQLKLHQRIHTGERPFSCNICEKKFRLSSFLKQHLLIHTGEKPFSCDVCEKTFPKKVDLTRHAMTHTGELPFACDVCEKRFNRADGLKVHQRIHTGEKPFACDVCEERFSQNSSLKAHKKTHDQILNAMSMDGEYFVNTSPS